MYGQTHFSTQFTKHHDIQTNNWDPVSMFNTFHKLKDMIKAAGGIYIFCEAFIYMVFIGQLYNNCQWIKGVTMVNSID